jgi:hypothetical protein
VRIYVGAVMLAEAMHELKLIRKLLSTQRE